jgi:hypothetical protein
MANKAEECRLRADQCEQVSKAAINPTERRIYSELARQWRQMAAQAEVLEERRVERLERLERLEQQGGSPKRLE